ncbi:hypothetical protein LMIY3S_03526 [Labrys miyagiensis]
MTVIPIQAFLAQSEQAAALAAAQNLANACGEATGAAAVCDPVFVPSLDALAQCPSGSLRLTSLLPEVDTLDEPWNETESRLQAAFETLVAAGDPVFICTVLRHAGEDEDAELLYRRRVRIRRLNLLAAELSRQTGAFVIDIDRVIADIGGRNLQTDYRLNGEAAAAVAGQAIALGIIVNGLDALVSFEAQEQMREIVARTIVRPNVIKELVPANVMALGRGRRKQTVSTIAETDGSNQAGRLLRQVLKREVAAGEALDRLRQAVQRRGAIESGALIASAVIRMVRGERR